MNIQVFAVFYVAMTTIINNPVFYVCCWYGRPKQTWWSCSACTFHNVNARTICEICETARPQLKTQTSDPLKFPSQSLQRLEWLLHDPNIASVWPRELLQPQSNIVTVTARKRICCPRCPHKETSSSSSLDFLDLPMPGPEDDRTITFFPANTMHAPVWLMVPAATVQASRDVRGLKSWMCSKLNRTRFTALSPANVTIFGTIANSRDIRNGHCLLPFLDYRSRQQISANRDVHVC